MLVVAGTAASVGSDHMASAIKKSSTTSAHSSTTTKPHPSNSGIKVNNVNIQRNLKCSTTGEGSGITGFGACSNAAASATDISGSVTGSGSSSRGNSGIEVFNKNDQSGLTCLLVAAPLQSAATDHVRTAHLAALLYQATSLANLKKENIYTHTIQTSKYLFFIF
ncbi:MAG: hypothetical protein WCF06_08730 [Nitrososphaeraceae archaeon]